MGKYAPAQKASTELAQVGADPQPLPAQARSSEHAVLVQQAFAAIEAAVSVEDLTRIRDQWDGIAAYAAKAKDFEIRATAEEIKARAERKLGQMMQEQKETVGLNKGGRPKTGFSKTRLPTPPEPASTRTSPTAPADKRRSPRRNLRLTSPRKRAASLSTSGSGKRSTRRRQGGPRRRSRSRPPSTPRSNPR